MNKAQRAGWLLVDEVSTHDDGSTFLKLQGLELGTSDALGDAAVPGIKGDKTGGDGLAHAGLLHHTVGIRLHYENTVSKSERTAALTLLRALAIAATTLVATQGPIRMDAGGESHGLSGKDVKERTTDPSGIEKDWIERTLLSLCFNTARDVGDSKVEERWTRNEALGGFWAREEAGEWTVSKALSSDHNGGKKEEESVHHHVFASVL